MRLHDLQPTPGARQKDRKRLGRGTGTGQGKTAGRGQDGQNSRSGGGVRPGFEGGQNPLLRRIPKRGFTNVFRKQYVTINVDRLNRFEDGTEVTEALLLETRVVSKLGDGVKVLGNGTLEKKLTVSATKFTATAKEKIEAKGGSVVEPVKA